MARESYFVTGFSYKAEIIETHGTYSEYYSTSPQHLGFETKRRATYELLHRRSIPEGIFLSNKHVFPEINWAKKRGEIEGFFITVDNKKYSSPFVLRGTSRELMFIAAVNALRSCAKADRSYSVVIIDGIVADGIRRANAGSIRSGMTEHETYLEIKKAENWLKTFDYKTPLILKDRKDEILNVVYHREKDPILSKDDGLDEPKRWWE